MTAKHNLIKLVFLLLLSFLVTNSNLLKAETLGNFAEFPVKPLSAKQKTKTKKISKKNTYVKSELPSERTWGIWSLGIGGFLIIFSVLSAMFFLGFPFYFYLLAILGVLLAVGVFLSISGVGLIDNSYIHYSDNPDMIWERLKPQIVREFIFSGMLLLIALALMFINYYITAFLCLLALFILITLAFMKLYNFKRVKKQSDTIK